MLKFNPVERPSASQLLKSSLFDSMRCEENEKKKVRKIPMYNDVHRYYSDDLFEMREQNSKSNDDAMKVYMD